MSIQILIIILAVLLMLIVPMIFFAIKFGKNNFEIEKLEEDKKFANINLDKLAKTNKHNEEIRNLTDDELNNRL